MPLSKNKGKDQAELKDIQPIVVRSHVAKIMEKAIMAKVAAEAPTCCRPGSTRPAIKRVPPPLHISAG